MNTIRSEMLPLASERERQRCEQLYYIHSEMLPLASGREKQYIGDLMTIVYYTSYLLPLASCRERQFSRHKVSCITHRYYGVYNIVLSA